MWKPKNTCRLKCKGSCAKGHVHVWDTARLKWGNQASQQNTRHWNNVVLTLDAGPALNQHCFSVSVLHEWCGTDSLPATDCQVAHPNLHFDMYQICMAICSASACDWQLEFSLSREQDGPALTIKRSYLTLYKVQNSSLKWVCFRWAMRWVIFPIFFGSNAFLSYKSCQCITMITVTTNIIYFMYIA